MEIRGKSAEEKFKMKKPLLRKLSLIFSRPSSIIILFSIILLSIGVVYALDVFVGEGIGNVSIGSSGLIGNWKLEGTGYVEYTENLAPYTDYSDRTYNQEYTASCWGGDLGTIYYYGGGGYKNLPYKKMIKTDGGTGGCYHDNHAGITIENNTVYTVSAWMKANRSVTVNGYALDLNRIVDNAYRVGSNLQLTTEWQRYSWVYYSGSDHAGNYQARNIIYVDDDLPLEVYWSGFQVEQRDYTTPYVNGIRQSKLTDSTPYSNHGTINGTRLTEDRFGKEESAVEFDGVDDYVNLGNILSDAPTGRTICYWYNPYTTSTMRWIFKGQTYETYTTGNSLSYRGRNSTTYYTASISTAGTPLTWRHFCGIWDSNGNLSGYLNGNYANSILINNIIMGDSNIFYIGGTTQYNINGSIDDLRIYNRALSEEEIKLLYESYKPQATASSSNAGLVLDMPLTSKWTKSETPGSEKMTDRTPYSNDGQNYGATITSTEAEFDGVGNYYVRSNNNVLIETSQTFSVWIYSNSTTELRGILTTHNHATTSNIGINQYGNQLSISIGYTDDTREYNNKISNYVISPNNWINVVLVFNLTENSMSFFVDGVFDQKWYLTKNIKFTSEKILVGQWSNTYLNNYKFNGSISNARIYNRALSADEVKLLYDRGRG